MSAPETFIPLADILRARCEPAVVPVASQVAIEALPAVQTCASADAIETARAGILREIRLFRAYLGDALEQRVERLLTGLASDVLVRDLRLAPIDIAALVARILDERPMAPLRIAVSPGDRSALAALAYTVVVDETLAPGDVVVTFADGDVDARLGVRLAHVLEQLS